MSLYQNIIPNTTNDAPIYTVSQLNNEAKQLLEEGLPQIQLIGEISNLARPASGHLYLTLKDQFAQVRCALFRNAARGLNFTPENGQQVLVNAKVSLYEARGDYQLILSKMELAGSGALQIAFDKLKKKLESEGLFDPAHKKPLPPFVQTLGVITSESGAAIRDILHVLRRRYSAMRIIIYPSLVQGDSAKSQIVQAIEIANRRQECDALLLARGGGSLEDLWPFNEEIVAQAIFNSEIPIITGIGHEIDFTIADFVADVRAPTPSAAAELVSPDVSNISQQLQQFLKRMTYYQIKQLQHVGHQLQALSKRLRHPRTELNEIKQRLQHLSQQLHTKMQQHLQHKHHRAQQMLATLLQQTPMPIVSNFKQRIQYLDNQLGAANKLTINAKKAELLHLSAQLEQLSPLQTLNRGYAIASRTTDNQILRSYTEIQPNQEVKVRLREGHLIANVTASIAED